MSLSCLNLRRSIWPLLALLAAGCSSQEPIVSYVVTKPEVVDPSLVPAEAKPIQTLGAIVLLDEAGWFFKLTGDPVQVEPQRGAFIDFVKSVQFAGSPERQPKWELPEGWTELPGSEFRFATLRLPAGPLEIAVSSLPRRDTPAEEYVLANINRWRGQVGQQPISAEELASTTETFKVGEFDTTFVSLVGESTGGGMPGAPFAPFAGAAAAPQSAPPAAEPAAQPAAEQGPVSYDTPAGWQPGKASAFRAASFEVVDGDKRVEITVVPLGAGSGTLLANVDRWRGMVGLEPTTEDDLAKSAKKVETLGVTGTYVELAGPKGTILGVVAPAGEQIWYIKLQGDSDLAARENSRFQDFVKSLKLN